MLYGFTYGNAADDLDELVRLGFISQMEREELSMEIYLASTPGATYRSRRIEHLDPLNGEEEDVPAWMRVKKLATQFNISVAQACELRYMLASFGMMYLIYDGCSLVKNAIIRLGFDGFLCHWCVKYGFMASDNYDPYLADLCREKGLPYYEEDPDPVAALAITHRREMVNDDSESPTLSSGNTKVIFGLTAQEIAHWPSKMKSYERLKELGKRAIFRSKSGTIKMDRYWWNIFWDNYRTRKNELAG